MKLGNKNVDHVTEGNRKMTEPFDFMQQNGRLLKTEIRGLLCQLFSERESVHMMDIELPTEQTVSRQEQDMHILRCFLMGKPLNIG